MSNEEKILFLLVKVQCDVLELKQRVEALEGGRLDDEGVARQLETLNKMRHLLTKEEADELAAAIGEE